MSFKSKMKLVIGVLAIALIVFVAINYNLYVEDLAKPGSSVEENLQELRATGMSQEEMVQKLREQYPLDQTQTERFYHWMKRKYLD